MYISNMRIRSTNSYILLYGAWAHTHIHALNISIWFCDSCITQKKRLNLTFLFMFTKLALCSLSYISRLFFSSFWSNCTNKIGDQIMANWISVIYVHACGSWACEMHWNNIDSWSRDGFAGTSSSALDFRFSVCVRACVRFVLFSRLDLQFFFLLFSKVNASYNCFSAVAGWLANWSVDCFGLIQLFIECVMSVHTCDVCVSLSRIKGRNIYIVIFFN